MKATDGLAVSRSERLATIREQIAAAAGNSRRLTAKDVAKSLDELHQEIAGTRGDAAI